MTPGATRVRHVLLTRGEGGKDVRQRVVLKRTSTDGYTVFVVPTQTIPSHAPHSFQSDNTLPKLPDSRGNLACVTLEI